MEVAAGQRRGQDLAAPGADRRAAEQRERHVGAELGAERLQLLAAEPGAPQQVAGDERRRRVGRAAGQPAGHRDPLAHVQPDVRRDPGPDGQQQRRPHREVGPVQRDLVDGHLAVALDRDLHAAAVGGRRGQLVVQADGVEDGGQLVVAVRAGRPDRELQVDLGRCAT